MPRMNSQRREAKPTCLRTIMVVIYRCAMVVYKIQKKPNIHILQMIVATLETLYALKADSCFT